MVYWILQVLLLGMTGLFANKHSNSVFIICNSLFKKQC